MRLFSFISFIFYHYKLIGITFLMSFNVSTAQDSLSQKSFESLYELYREHKNTDPKKAAIYAEKLYQFAIKENNKKKIAKALYSKAYIQKNLGNDSRALNNINTSISIARHIKNDSLLLKNTNLKGIIFSRQGNYKESIKHYLEAKSIAKRLGNLNDILVISRNIGIIRVKTNDYLNAIDVFSHNLNTIRTSKIANFDREYALNNYNLSDTYLKIGDLSQAQMYSDRALSFISRKSLSDLRVPFYSNRAIINFQQQQYLKTIEICNELVNEITKTKNDKELLTPYLYLGRSYFKLKEYDSAIAFFENIKTLVITYKISFPELGETYSLLAKSYISNKNLEEAKINLDLFTAFNKKKEVTNRDVNYKIYKELETNIQDELQALNAKNEQQKTRVTYLSILAVLLVVGFSSVHLKKQSLNEKRYKKLLKTIEGLEASKKEPEKVDKKTPLDVAPENVEHILKALDKFESSELFLNTQCNLVYVAKKLKTNTTYLSKVINTHKEKPFKSYLTELRINAALIHLKNNKQLRLYTIKALAEEFGFRRYETFSRAFKTQTGIYPSVYIKNLQKEKI